MRDEACGLLRVAGPGRRCRGVWRVACAFAAAVGFVLVSRVAGATALGVRGAAFTLDGKPTFMLGCSYFAGAGAPAERLAADLDRLRAAGFKWVRVWATWNAFGTNVSAVDGDGRARQPTFDRLKQLVDACDRRGMAVDITLTRAATGASGALRTQAAHAQAVRTLAAGLKKWRNWYLDLANERNIHDGRYVSMADLARLAAVERSVDPARLLTASQGGDISRDELPDYLTVARVDFVCPHRPRAPDSPAHTDETTRTLLRWMRELGRVVPVLYQEPFRRGYADWQPAAADYLADAAGAARGGAAGWCLHNGSQRGAADEEPRRCMDLRTRSLFDQLDKVEQEVVRTIARGLPSSPTLLPGGEKGARPAGGTTRPKGPGQRQARVAQAPFSLREKGRG